jgi:uroporphyrinogen decarboxylase
MMTSYEVVKRAIEFSGPDRIPILWSTDLERSDIVDVGYTHPTWESYQKVEDEWGCVWEKLEKTMGQVTGHPIADWDDYPNYKFPDPHADERFDGIAEVIDKYSDRYISAVISVTGFNRMTFLRGYDHLLEDLYLNRDKLEELADRCFEIEMEIIKGYSQFDIDGIWFADDWGTQNALMISPNMWRDFFKGRYKMQFDLIHSLGMHVLFHSCGYIFDIIGDLIEIGVDVFNLDQPMLMGIDRLADSYGGKVCFCCPVDIQQVLPKGDLEEIAREAKHMINALGKFNGGFIGKEYPPGDIDLPEDGIEIMYSTFKRYNPFKQVGG